MVFTSVVLFGCQFEESTVKKTSSQQYLEENEKLEIDVEFSVVTLTIIKEGKSIVFDDYNALEQFKSIISSAVKENGIVNIANPDYSVDIINENKDKQVLHLWLGGAFEESTFMNTNDTHTIYILPGESTNKILDLIEQV
ncbi:hypothetical protein [Psychrobacillus sp. NPDC093200]|uniref:hypothetical protein n=1 Tax=Psychrobacillus sp. NPDC093200 TaxID=3390656 RepID=UPI003CFE1FA3